MTYSNFSYISELYGKMLILKELEKKEVDTAKSNQSKATQNTRTA